MSFSAFCMACFVTYFGVYIVFAFFCIAIGSVSLNDWNSFWPWKRSRHRPCTVGRWYSPKTLSHSLYNGAIGIKSDVLYRNDPLRICCERLFFYFKYSLRTLREGIVCQPQMGLDLFRYDNRWWLSAGERLEKPTYIVVAESRRACMK